ncbi:hypothetical protein F4821DRAFT_176041 [Hypoxylon rubiginosum]|uniref:Uncharacterized protein n=1 Tax=Hypoxylon rubiginosum TaxID=110542 RepID=A0ACC0CV11_9PEZI|nr:hypothetical protein F4821DRAFT_176041 [Hypoxylon rubiginosum]
MSSLYLSRPLRLARPLGLISRSRFQPHHARPSLVSLYHYEKRPGVRSFHIASGVLAVTQATQDAMISLHSATHVPWFLIIPLLAAGINIVFRLPLDAYTRIIIQRRRNLSPVLEAWRARIVHDVFKDSKGRVLRPRMIKEGAKKIAANDRRIYRSLGLQTWKTFAGFLGLPIWLVGIECIRRLCGGPRGIIGSLVAGFTGDVSHVPAAASNAEGTSTGEAAGPAADTMTATASHISTVDPSTTASAVVEHARYLPDPSIALEGCLWFPDLTAADPYHILPIALSVVLVSQVIPKTNTLRRQVFGLDPKDGFDVDSEKMLARTSQWRLRLNRAFILLAAAVGPITMDLPAALHLYWLCSSLIHWATNWTLSHLIPAFRYDNGIACEGVEPWLIRPRQKEGPPPQARPRKRKNEKGN